MSFVLIILAVVYLGMIGWLYRGMDTIKPFTPTTQVPQNSFSVLIPFRDEAEYLPQLLQSLALLKYPSTLFEVILIDDASTDNSRGLISAFADKSDLDIKILNNIRHSNSPKKDAIQLALTTAKYPWIVSTDADVTLPDLWLNTFDQFIQSHRSKLMVGPVAYQNNHAWLGQFQALDQLSLQGSTLGGFGIDRPFLCSGANLCYEKEAFTSVHPFKDNSHIASGDDIFLLHRFKKQFPEEVFFIKSRDILVHTYPEKSWGALVQQRLRWAAKTSQVQHPFTRLMGVLILLVNVSVFIALVGLFLGQWQLALLFLALKFGIDYLFLRKTAQLWQHQFTAFDYIKSAVVYPFFISFIGVYALFSGYQWKGETYKK